MRRRALLGATVAAALPRRGRAQSSKIRLAFPTPPTTLSLPFYVAKANGWLDGLDVEEIYLSGDANALRALISGSADIATVGTLNVLTADEISPTTRVIHSWQPIGDYNLVAGIGKADTIADLAGKMLAASGPGGPPQELPKLVLRNHKIDPSTLRFVNVGGHSARLQAVLSGRVDAALVNTVTALRAVEAGQVKILARVPKEFPKLGYVYNVVMAKTLADPALAPAFQTLTTAGMRACRFIMADPDQAAAIMHDRVKDLDLDYLKAVVRDLNGDNVWGVDGGIDPDITAVTGKFYADLGELKAVIPPDQVLDGRFVVKAAAALKAS